MALNLQEIDWNSALAYYTDALRLKAAEKEKSRNTLIELDKWYQEALPRIINSRKPSHLLHYELEKLMQWKLMRGKWRPRLMQFITSNPATLVEELTKESFSLVSKNQFSLAVSTLCKLKGVGPATASAILAAGAPDKAGFFADEVAEVFLLTKPSYKLDEYLEINGYLTEVAERLNKEKLDSEWWTPHKVELAVWSYKVVQQKKPELLFSLQTHVEENPKKKIKT